MSYGTEELFSRQIPVFTKEGQQKIRETTILIIGVGGLGSTVSTVLSRSGVGHLVIVDFDTVSLSNIHRQLLYCPDDIGKAKVEAASQNPLLCLSKITPLTMRIDQDAVEKLIKEYNPFCIMDCTDNFSVRYATNAACAKHSIPFVFGSVTAEMGQISVFCRTKESPNCPCFSCIHPDPPKPYDGPPPVIPGICTIVGTLQAQQALAMITGVGDVLVGELLTVDLIRLRFRRFKIRDRKSDCIVCNKSN